MRYATQPGADIDDSLSREPEPARCETCGEDIEGTVYARTSGGVFEFCCEACFVAFVKAQERN